MLDASRYAGWFGQTWVLGICLAGVVWLRFLGQELFSPNPAMYDVLHLAFGGLCAAAILKASRWWRWSPGKARSMAVLGVLGVAAFIEAVQPAWGQEEDPMDVVAAAFGAAACVAWDVRKEAGSRWRRAVLSGLGVLAVLLGLVRPIGVVWLLGTRVKSYPVLASFETPVEWLGWEARGSRLARSRDVASTGRYSLKVQVCDNTPYPGATLVSPRRPLPAFRCLSFSVWTLPTNGRVSTLSVRVDDAQGLAYADRYQTSCRLTSGWTSCKLDLLSDGRTPNGRKIDANRICAITFFIEEGRPGMVFYLDDIRWEP
jgi:hypothetical protein